MSMSATEFKAWFQGFSEGMGKMPNAKQWKLIQERAAQIDDKETIVYRERPTWYPSWYWTPNYNFTMSGSTSDQVLLSEVDSVSADAPIMTSTAYNIGQEEFQRLG